MLITAIVVLSVGLLEYIFSRPDPEEEAPPPATGVLPSSQLRAIDRVLASFGKGVNPEAACTRAGIGEAASAHHSK